LAVLQTIQKIGPVLDLFTVEHPEWGVSEVAEAIGVPRSSAHALLASLVETGLLQSRARGRYRVGWRVIELGETLRGTVNVRTVAYPVLEQLVKDYGETSHLAVMERSRVLYVEKILGTHMVNVTGARVGAQLEPHCSAVGKVLLAHRTSQEIRRILAGTTLRRFTPTTITDSDALCAELDTVTTAGVAYDRGEVVSDVHCVAAPVRDDMGQVIAAVSLTAPENRFNRSRAEFTQAVKAAATEISARLASSEDSPTRTPLDDPTSGGGVIALQAKTRQKRSAAGKKLGS
jgi:DNA-binding IclR family transcriptional regulator